MLSSDRLRITVGLGYDAYGSISRSGTRSSGALSARVAAGDEEGNGIGPWKPAA